MKSPEQVELEEKQAEYEALEAEYTASELEFNTLSAALDAFRKRYFASVGSLYSRLDDLRARIQEEIARQYAHPPAAQQAAQAARKQATGTSTEVDGAREALPSESVPFAPSDELKKLYRHAVKLIHPDRAENEDDRQLRDRLMAEINAAYRVGDIAAIKRVLEQYTGILSNPTGDGVSAQLSRIIKLIAKTRVRIAELRALVVELTASDWHELMIEVEGGDADGLDPLGQLARKLRGEISTEEARLSSLRGKVPEPVD